MQNQNNINFIKEYTNNKIILIKTIEDSLKIIQWFKSYGFLGDGSYIFRGQINDLNGKKFRKWKLESSYKRNFINGKLNVDKKHWLDEYISKVKKMQKKESNKRKLAEIIPYQQHHGQDTPLIDFTLDISKAIFFAIDGISILNAKNYVSIFFFELNRNDLLSIEELNDDEIFIKYFKNKKFKAFKYENIDDPHASAQQSYFVFEGQNFSKVKEIRILNDEKIINMFKKFLSKNDINNMSIYPGKIGAYKYYVSGNDNNNNLKLSKEKKVINNKPTVNKNDIKVNKETKKINNKSTVNKNDIKVNKETKKINNKSTVNKNDIKVNKEKKDIKNNKKVIERKDKKNNDNGKIVEISTGFIYVKFHKDNLPNISSNCKIKNTNIILTVVQIVNNTVVKTYPINITGESITIGLNVKKVDWNNIMM